MSKAFTKEDGTDEPPLTRPRAANGGERRPITAAGYRRLLNEQEALEARRRALQPSPPSALPTAPVPGAFEASPAPKALGAAPGALATAAAMRELAARGAELAATLEQVVPQPPLAHDPEQVVFGAWVTVEDEAGATARYRIVGPDEADAREGRLSLEAPLARALLGRRVGDVALVERPRGDRELTVRGIHR